MIISVARLKTFITTTESDAVLQARLEALEHLIRKYTNNNFQNRNIRFKCDVAAHKIELETNLLQIGDTVQISESMYSEGVFDITGIAGGYITLNKNLVDEDSVLVTKVEYPMDVQMGVVDLMKWELENREKVGVQSETLSRHTVTYFNMDGDNSSLGYPKSLIGFLKPYIKARF